jgi:hypothetical protein
MMPLKYLSLCCFLCSIIIPTWANSDSDAASYAALQIQLLLSDQQTAEEEPVATSDIEANEMQACDTKVEKVHSLLQFIPSADQAHGPEARNAFRELLLLSKNSVFDQSCSDWLHDILTHFNTVKFKNERYKQYLYSLLANNSDQEMGTLAVATLKYSLLHGALTLEEWKKLKTALRYTNHQDLKQIVVLMSQATLSKTQNETVFRQQAGELLALATDGELGMPLKIKPGYLIGLLLTNVQRDFPDQFMLTYTKYHDRIDKPARFEKFIRNYISSSPSADRYELLSLYLNDIYSSDVKLNKRDANKLFSMLKKLRPEDSLENSKLMVIWRDIVTQNERIISDIVQYSTAKAAEKMVWFDLYSQNQAKVSQLPL